MDNRRIDISSHGRRDFDLAMQLAFAVYNKAVGYRIHANTMVLYWVESDTVTTLPYAMNCKEASDFVWGWLEQSSPTNPEPDHDGDNVKGFRVYNDDWGHVFKEYQAFVGVTPIWAIYGK